MTFWDTLDTSLKHLILAQLAGLCGTISSSESSFTVEPISAHASKRQMIRLCCSACQTSASTSPNLPKTPDLLISSAHQVSSAILVLTPDLPEQLAFSAFTKHFLNFQLPVPQIYWEDHSKGLMLLEDLGHQTLYDILSGQNQVTGLSPSTSITSQSQPHSVSLGRTSALSPAVKAAYQQVVKLLPTLQIKAGESVPYEMCYPSSSFNRAEMLWDTSYFEREYLTRSAIKFSSFDYAKACNAFVDALGNADSRYFMYRDLQSRNIMVKNAKVYFIDYQGGRRGPLHYDLASLLFQSRAQLPAQFRNELIESYLNITESLLNINRAQFKETLQLFVILRLMQALATYARVGIGEGKPFFRESIPFARSMLRELIPDVRFPSGSEYLANILNEVAINH